MGYAFDCPGPCGRPWSKRYIDERTHRCLPCARAWRRDDMMSRRRGLGGVPLTKNPPAHPFESRVLHREVDLNSSEVQALIVSNTELRAEVTRYVMEIVRANGRPKTAFYGLLPLLPASKVRVKPNHVDIPEEPVATTVSDEVQAAVEKHVDVVMNAIDAEVVEDSK